MREALRRLLGRTKLDRIEAMQREHAQRLERLAHEVQTLLGDRVAGLVRQAGAEGVQPMLAAVQEHGRQVATLSARLAMMHAVLEERDRLRQRLQEEEARAAGLAEQNGRLLGELDAERRALREARAGAEAADELRARCEAAERAAVVASRERDALRAHAERLEAA
ncbi:MAG TPA: hypothetical protein VK081_02190, partial [Planctomycetota bacterium]|nr:hypothetical protein [Planctomycetota bacterium]